MGMEDRDYYWEDRKRREEKLKRDMYYRPKEFRGRGGKGRGRPSIGGWDGEGRPGRPYSATSIVIFIMIGMLIALGLKSFGVI